jgi:hypothetical protein
MIKVGAALIFAAAIALPVTGNAAGISQNDVTGTIGNEHDLDAAPVFDMTQNCAQAFSSKEAIGNCIAREEISKKQLLSDWTSLSARVKHICLARVLPQGTGRAYLSLADCTVKEGRLDRFRTTESQR